MDSVDLLRSFIFQIEPLAVLYYARVDIVFDKPCTDMQFAYQCKT